jgi:hypothetical protein
MDAVASQEVLAGLAFFPSEDFNSEISTQPTYDDLSAQVASLKSELGVELIESGPRTLPSRCKPDKLQ